MAPLLDTGAKLSCINAAFLDAQYRAWVADPGSVDPVWAALFQEMQDEPVNGARFAPPPPDRRSIFAAQGAGAVFNGDVDAETAWSRLRDGVARPDNPSLCTFPITALRVTPPRRAAI